MAPRIEPRYWNKGDEVVLDALIDEQIVSVCGTVVQVYGDLAVDVELCSPDGTKKETLQMGSWRPRKPSEPVKPWNLV